MDNPGPLSNEIINIWNYGLRLPTGVVTTTQTLFGIFDNFLLEPG